MTQDTVHFSAPMAAADADWISALPDEALMHVLSFLPVTEAVRTGLVARRWRHLWRSMPLVRIYQRDGFETILAMNAFVNRLFLLRDHSSALEECQFDIESYFDEDFKQADLWIRHALCCRVRSLRFHSYSLYGFSKLADAPLISQCLTKLDLDSVSLKSCFLDFSSCPVLEDLKMTFCRLDTHKISSKSLKWLSISYSVFDETIHTHIFVPSVVSLEIDECWGLSPFLESMPSLATASIIIGRSCDDYKIVDDDNDDHVVILKGLSEAIHLELMAEVDKPCIFKRDLRWCPTFSNLKTLILNVWCMGSDISALICFLWHSPILEELALQLSKEAKYRMKAEGSSMPWKQCFPSKHLNVIEVKYTENHYERALEVTKVLSSHGLWYSS